MPISGATSFTVNSFLTSNTSGATDHIQMQGVCSDVGLKFKVITIGVSSGGTNSMPTDPRRSGLSIQVPQLDFDNLLQCLQQLPVIVTINYELIGTFVSVTSVTCTAILAGFQLLDMISTNTEQIPQIAKAQHELSAQLTHVENLVKRLDPKHQG